MKLYLLASIVLLFLSCQDVRQSKNAVSALTAEQTNVAEQLIGEWRNNYTKVIMRTFKNSDSTKIMEVHEQDWEASMKMKPIRTFFNADGTYNSEHRNLDDSIVYNPSGRWNVVGDSLFMMDTFPQKGISYKYRVIIDSDIAEFHGVEDFDLDGFKDDEYYGSQRRQ